MGCEWPIRQLKDVSDEVTVGYVGTMADQYMDQGVLFLRSLNIRPFGLDLSDVKFVAYDFHKKIRKSALHPGDVVIVRTGRPGTCAVIPEGLGQLNCSDLVIVRCSPELRPHFACYWINAMASDHVHAYSVGAVQQHFNVSSAKVIPIPVPSLLAQDQVLSVLRSLDCRIDLLRQTNTTLEAIAQALFKSWFVDFDPVHAKAEGREPEIMDAATAALFPSEFEESELGLIPKGWCADRLGDVSSNPRDQAKPDKIDPATPYIGLEHMPRKSIALSDHGTADGLGSGKFWFEESDVLFGKLRPYFHKVGLAPFKGICSTDILVLRPLQPAFHAFLLMHSSSDALIDYATRLSNGAKMPRSNWKDIANYPICIPPDSAAQAFNETVDPMLCRIKANVEAASTLAKFRDTLLPRLISGKLRLPESESLARKARV
jgi:type I restriction enzyme S subunit